MRYTGTAFLRLLAYPRDWLAIRTLPVDKPRAHIHTPRNAGEVAADAIAAFIGSWPAVWLHVMWFAGWFLFRLDINHLTLVVSLEAIFLCIFLLMAGNRTAAKDHLRDDHEAEEVDTLMSLNQQQLEILRQQNEILDALHALSQPKEAA